jgi:hypothetical protein
VYYKEAVAALVVFDVTRPKTFEAVKRWKADLDSKVELPETLGGGPIHTILLANKVTTTIRGATIDFWEGNSSASPLFT